MSGIKVEKQEKSQFKNWFRTQSNTYHNQEKSEFINVLNVTKQEIDILYNKIQNAEADELIESYIYQLKAMEIQYDYYMKKIKKLSAL